MPSNTPQPADLCGYFWSRRKGGPSERSRIPGIGISPQELPLIFHEFYRTAEARKMGVRGTGLGLPLVKRIVEGYGGSLEVKSTVGKGSLFRFRLPIADVPSIEDPNTGAGDPP